jgi:hypothetical protein
VTRRSRRGIERTVDTLTDDLLTGLSIAERVAMAIRARAEDDVDRLDRLKDTAEFKTYKAPNKHFRQGDIYALTMGFQASLDLLNRAWRFHHARLAAAYRWEAYHAHGDDSPLGEPTEENGHFEKEAHDAAASLLARYLAWEDVAQEVYGIPVETFLKQALAEQQFQHIRDAVAIADGSAFDGPDSHDGESPDEAVGEFGWAREGEVTLSAGETLSAPEAADHLAAEYIAIFEENLGPSTTATA